MRQLRARLTDWRAQLTEAALARYLDFAVTTGLDAARSEPVLYAGTSAALVHLGPDFPGVYAVVKRSDRRGLKPESIVEVWGEEKAVAFTRPPRAAPEAVGGSVQAETEQESTCIAQQPSNSWKGKEPRKPGLKEGSLPPFVLVIEEAGGTRYEQVPSARLKERVSALVSRGQTPRVYQRVELKVQVQLGLAGRVR